MKPLRIVFMGTPEFAVPCLEALVSSGRQVVGVVTAEDKPQGRGQKSAVSAVKACAQKHGLRILQPTKLKAHEFVEELKSLQADLQIVVAFRMLPEIVWAMPRLGTFNLHASLLPKYRGAAPINWAIINGEKETGVTTFFLQHEIDTGSIIFQETEPILDTDDVGSLYERLMNRGAKLVLKTVEAIENGAAPRLPQVWDGSAPHAPKIFKETCKVDWKQSGEQIKNFVRGLSPYPTAWTELNGRSYKVYHVSAERLSSDKPVGEIQTDSKSYLKVSCSDGWVNLVEFQPEGKRRMAVADFLRGNKI